MKISAMIGRLDFSEEDGNAKNCSIAEARIELAHGRVERAYINGEWGAYIDGRLYANSNNDAKMSATVHHMVLAILPLGFLAGAVWMDDL